MDNEIKFYWIVVALQDNGFYLFEYDDEAYQEAIKLSKEVNGKIYLSTDKDFDKQFKQYMLY